MDCFTFVMSGPFIGDCVIGCASLLKAVQWPIDCIVINCYVEYVIRCLIESFIIGNHTTYSNFFYIPGTYSYFFKNIRISTLFSDLFTNFKKHWITNLFHGSTWNKNGLALVYLYFILSDYKSKWSFLSLNFYIKNW